MASKGAEARAAAETQEWAARLRRTTKKAPPARAVASRSRLPGSGVAPVDGVEAEAVGRGADGLGEGDVVELTVEELDGGGGVAGEGEGLVVDGEGQALELAVGLAVSGDAGGGGGGG